MRVGPHKYGHWFDGDGQVTAFQLDGEAGTVHVTSTVVKTGAYVAQQKAGEDAKPVSRYGWTQVRCARGLLRAVIRACASDVARLFPSLSPPIPTPPFLASPRLQASPWWRNLLRLPVNPANTSVLIWGGKLYALCEVRSGRRAAAASTAPRRPMNEPLPAPYQSRTSLRPARVGPAEVCLARRCRAARPLSWTRRPWRPSARASSTGASRKARRAPPTHRRPGPRRLP